MTEIMTMPKYEAYKDSGVEWLGEIPEEWEIAPAKRTCLIKKEINTGNKCNNILSLTLRGVVNNNRDNPEGLIPKDYATYQVFEKDDLVFKLIDLENFQTSRVGLVHETGAMSPAYIRFKTSSNIHAKYAYYYYYNLYLNAVFNKLGAGVRSTLGPKDLLDLPLLQPRLAQQHSVVKFLDNKIIKIHEAITLKEKQIELLKERKQVIIQKAVTHGVNSNVSMKDSGVYWIGELPEHWEIRRSKFLFTQRKERAWKSDVQLSATQAYGVIPQSEYEALSGKTVVKIQLHLDKRKHVEKDDFVISMRSFQGGLERAWSDGCIRSSYVVLRPLEEINPDFYGYLLKLPSYIKALQRTGNFIRDGQDLNFDNFSQVDLFIPPLDEQEAIVKYLKEFIVSSNSGIELLQQQIEKLKEYKTTLIDSAVTGKIKVPSVS